MSTNSRTFQHPQQSIRTHSFRVQYHNGTVLTKTCRSAISKLLQEPFAIVHLCTHHVGVISHLGSLPTIFQIQIYLLSCADIQDPPHRTSAYLSHLVTAPVTLWAHSALLFRFAAFCTITWDHLSRRAFHCIASTTWNSLLNMVTLSDSLSSLKSRLKTRVFNQTFNPTCS